MKIDVICSSSDHPVNRWLTEWCDRHAGVHRVSLITAAEQADGGDILFLISCSEIIPKSIRKKYAHVLIVHASDLPNGRGWSPHVWSILTGAEEIKVSLLNAEDSVDTGAVWCKTSFVVPKHALYDEINEALFAAEIALMDEVMSLIKDGERPTPQQGSCETAWPRRTPKDSEIDPEAPIVSQFDKMRVADPLRYPAFFTLHGHRYIIELRKADEKPGNN